MDYRESDQAFLEGHKVKLSVLRDAHSRTLPLLRWILEPLNSRDLTEIAELDSMPEVRWTEKFSFGGGEFDFPASVAKASGPRPVVMRLTTCLEIDHEPVIIHNLDREQANGLARLLRIFWSCDNWSEALQLLKDTRDMYVVMSLDKLSRPTTYNTFEFTALLLEKLGGRYGRF